MFAVNADTSLPLGYERNVTTSAFAGSNVNFNCSSEVHSVSQSVSWRHCPSTGGSVVWFNGRRINSELRSRGVTVEGDGTRGWSILTIPRVRLADGGTFQCFMDSRCQVNFYLTIARK